tara:strand:- start:1902 stop:2024 length:123 start_codon:yes stop_codon:yes gene_type:complete
MEINAVRVMEIIKDIEAIIAQDQFVLDFDPYYVNYTVSYN